MSDPPAGFKHPAQSGGIKIEQNHLSDEKLGEENKNIPQGGFEYYAGECQRSGQIVQTERGHGHGTDYHSDTIKQVSDDNRFLMAK